MPPAPTLLLLPRGSDPLVTSSSIVGLSHCKRVYDASIRGYFVSLDAGLRSDACLSILVPPEVAGLAESVAPAAAGRGRAAAGSSPPAPLPPPAPGAAPLLLLQLRLPPGPLPDSDVSLSHLTVTLNLAHASAPADTSLSRRIVLSTAYRAPHITALHTQLPLGGRLCEVGLPQGDSPSLAHTALPRGVWCSLVIDYLDVCAAAWPPQGASPAALRAAQGNAPRTFHLTSVALRGAVDLRCCALLRGSPSPAAALAGLADPLCFPPRCLARLLSMCLSVAGEHLLLKRLASMTMATLVSRRAVQGIGSSNSGGGGGGDGGGGGGGDGGGGGKGGAALAAAQFARAKGGSPTAAEAAEEEGKGAEAPAPAPSRATAVFSPALVVPAAPAAPSPPPLPRSPLAALKARDSCRRESVLRLLASPSTASSLAHAVSASPAVAAMFLSACGSVDDGSSSGSGSAATTRTRLPMLKAYSRASAAASSSSPPSLPSSPSSLVRGAYEECEAPSFVSIQSAAAAAEGAAPASPDNIGSGAALEQASSAAATPRSECMLLEGGGGSSLAAKASRALAAAAAAEEEEGLLWEALASPSKKNSDGGSNSSSYYSSDFDTVDSSALSVPTMVGIAAALPPPPPPPLTRLLNSPMPARPKGTCSAEGGTAAIAVVVATAAAAATAAAPPIARALTFVEGEVEEEMCVEETNVAPSQPSTAGAAAAAAAGGWFGSHLEKIGRVDTVLDNLLIGLKGL